MFYIIYKITNNINGKIYIGKHKTANLNDSYMGSGKLLTRAIKKHGIGNFTKDILYVFDCEQTMNDKEKELVTEEFCLRNDTYNLCNGGHGGFSYINRCNLNNSNKDIVAINKKISDALKGRSNPQYSNLLKKLHAEGKAFKPPSFKGKTHSIETRKKIGGKNSIHQQGSGNSQYGTMWITNGTQNCRIKKNAPIEEGWRKGRILSLEKQHRLKEKAAVKQCKQDDIIKEYKVMFEYYKNNKISLRELGKVFKIQANTLSRNFNKYFSNEYKEIIESRK